MGQRANLITIENGDYTLRYDHWCANRLDEILFWGAGHALDYFDAQETVGADGWLDDVWAEGGAVLDLDKRHLLWWGGEDVLFELPVRRVFLKLQRKIWDGWTIEWAHRGILDLAEYVNYPKENVLTNRENAREPFELKMVEKGTFTETIGCYQSVEGEIKFFVLNQRPENYLYNGIDLVNQCKSVKGVGEIIWTEWERDDSFPRGGFWIDEKRKILEFWEIMDCPNTVQELKRLWIGWDVVWHQDDYEFQVEKAQEKIILPEIDEAKLFKQLRESLLREEVRTGLQSALETKDLLEESGKRVELNPWMFKSHHVENPLESKLQIWERNFGE